MLINYHIANAEIPSKKWDKAYRFGFNGQHKENEIAGVGNHNTALFGELDTRLGRRWNLDPKPNASMSPYSMFGDNPILNSDILLDTPTIANRLLGAAKVVGGGIEAVAGAAGGVATSWTGVGGVIGGAALLHGSDVAASGFTQMMTGEVTPSFTERGVSKGLQSAGISKGNADIAASYTDATLSIMLTGTSVNIKDATYAMRPPLLVRLVTSKDIAQTAKSLNIYSAQKSLAPGAQGEQLVNGYLAEMNAGTFNYGASGYIEKTGRIIISDGNHKMNAAIQYSLENGGNMKYVDMLINKGNFNRGINSVKEYVNEIYNFPTLK